MNVADSSVGKASLIVAIPLFSTVGRLRRDRPVPAGAARLLWYAVAAAQVIGAVGAGVWHAKFAALDAPPVPGGSQDVFFLAFYFVLGAVAGHCVEALGAR